MKSIILKKRDITNHVLPDLSTKVIFLYKKVYDKPNNKIRILDLGSGLGKTTIKLRHEGYISYGADIDEEQVILSNKTSKSFGFENIFHNISKDNKTPFEDNFFDIVLTDNVLEHVHDHRSLISEIARITKKGGFGYHTFPARYCLVEPHLKMPLLNFLPSGNFREFIILLFVKLGIEPFWNELNELEYSDKAKAYSDYLNDYTTYPSFNFLDKVFNYNLIFTKSLFLYSPWIKANKYVNLVLNKSFFRKSFEKAGNYLISNKIFTIKV